MSEFSVPSKTNPLGEKPAAAQRAESLSTSKTVSRKPPVRRTTGNGAVSHGDHLRQTARFEHGRDEKEIAPGVDEMREGFVVPEHETASTRVLALHLIGGVLNSCWCAGSGALPRSTKLAPRSNAR